MKTQTDKDRELSFSIINYLSASYRGKLAGYTLLGQLEQSSFEQGEIEVLLNVTDRVAEWFTALLRGEILFCENWQAPETFEAQNALGLLTKLKPDLLTTASKIDAILDGKEPVNIDNAKWLFGVLTRSAMARDVYLRGFVLYGENFKKIEIAQNYGAMLAHAVEHNQLVQQGVEIMRGAEFDLAKLGEGYVTTLVNGCSDLPSVFRTHAHDINLLLSVYKGGINFENLDFAKDSADLWMLAGVGPEPAGYWRAYGFGAEETAAWLKSFLGDPAEALNWRSAGFSPDSAKPWAELGFPLALAKPWNDAGYDPLKAKEHIDRGVMNPPTNLK